MKKQIKRFLSLITTSVLIASCYSNVLASPIKTQNLPIQNITNTSNVNVYNENIDKLLNNLFNIKAQKESYSLDKDLLKYKEDVGLITKQQYKQQKYLIENQKDTLELQENQIYLTLTQLGYTFDSYQFNTQNIDIVNLQNEFYNLKIQRNDIRNKMKQLESQYLMGQLTRENFVTEYAKLERQDYELSRKIKSIANILYSQRGYYYNYKRH